MISLILFSILGFIPRSGGGSFPRSTNLEGMPAYAFDGCREVFGFRNSKLYVMFQKPYDRNPILLFL